MMEKLWSAYTRKASYNSDVSKKKKKRQEIYFYFPRYIKAVDTKFQMQNGILTDGQFNPLDFITFHPNWPPLCFKVHTIKAAQTSNTRKAVVMLFTEKPISALLLSCSKGLRNFPLILKALNYQSKKDFSRRQKRQYFWHLNPVFSTKGK